MHVAPAIGQTKCLEFANKNGVIPIHAHISIPGCTEALCKTQCLEHAKHYNQVLKSSQCEKAHSCYRECAAKQHLPLTMKVMGLTDAEDNNGTFV